MAKKPANYHVTPRQDGWAAKQAGSARAAAVVSTQKEAIDIARRLSENKGGGDVFIHGKDGRIRDRDTTPSGNDPNPPKDYK